MNSNNLAWREQRLRASDGVSLRVVEAGPADAPALLFVPGWALGAEIWRGQLGAFSKTHRVISFDPRGQGGSDKPATGYGLRRRALDILDLLQACNPVKPLIVAWSLGALELMEYLRLGGPASGAVFVDNSLDPAFASEARPGLQLIKSLRDRDYEQVMRDFVRGLFRQPLSKDRLDLLEKSALEMPRAAALEALKKSGFGGGLSNLLKDPKLPPVLLLGTEVYRSEFEGLKAVFPSLQLEVFGEAGHALFVDQASRFNQVLEAFIRNARSGTRA